MAQRTDYHDYSIPVTFDESPEDTNVWGDILNETFRKLDEEVILRGTSSDRPAPESDGRLFLDTSDKRLQYDNGAGWEYLGAQAQFLDSGAFVKSTPKEIDFGQFITVTDSGANTVKLDVDDAFVDASGDTMSGSLTLGGDLIASAGATIWDDSAAYVPEAALQHSDVTVTAGNALTGGGTVTLGNATTIDVDETAINHGSLAGLTATDHHTQYIHQDGRRGFTSPVDGQDPSAQTHLATKDYVDSTAQGLEYKESVLAEQDAPPGTPASGDRYLTDHAAFAIVAVDTTNHVFTVSGDQSARFDAGEYFEVRGSTGNDGTYSIASVTYDSTNNETDLAVNETFSNTTADGDILHADGAWNGHGNELAEYDGTAWVFNVPNEGWSVFIENADVLKTYYNGDWVVFGSTIDHGALQGLGGDDHNQYLHRDGRREMSGDLGVGNYSVTNLNNIVKNDSRKGISFKDPTDGTLVDIFDSQSADTLVVRTGNLSVTGGDVKDGVGNVVYDQTNNWVPQARVEQGAGSLLNADQVDGYEAADLRNDKNHAQLTSTDTTTDINTTSWVSIPWNKELNLDAGAFSHDSANSPAVITFDEAGTYRVTAAVSYDTAGADVNPGLKLLHNTTRKATFGLSGVVTGANGHTEASNVVVRTITVAAGDTLEVQATAMGNTTPSATMRNEESILEIEQLSMSVANAGDADTLDSLDSSQFLRADKNTTLSGGQLGIDLTDGTTDAMQFTDTSGGTASVFTLRYDDLPLRFWRSASTGTSGPTLYMDQSGNVGIDNGAPAYTLDVSGTVNASGGLFANGTVDLQSNPLLNVSTATVEQYQDLEPQAEPTAPTGDTKRLFVDAADGGLKVKDSTGSVTTIAK